MPEIPAIERRLSPSEKLWWILNHECSVNFVMHARVHGALSEEILRPALKAVRDRHPLLRAAIERDGWNQLRFKTSGVPALALRQVEPPPGSWADEAETELNARFQAEEGPLAREIRRSLWAGVERGEPFVYVHQYKDHSALTGPSGLGPLGIKAYCRWVRMTNMGGPAFSNIGRVDIRTRQGPFTIRELGFAASGSVLSPLMACAATIGPNTTWNFVGMDPLLTKDHTRRIADRAREILRKQSP